jgi:hypothetical protein
VLRNLNIREISLVDRGAGEGCRIVLAKRVDDEPDVELLTAGRDRALMQLAADAKTRADEIVRQEKMERAMETNAVLKREAFSIWQDRIAEFAKTLNVNRTRATDAFLRTEEGARLWNVVKNLNGSEIVKLGNDGLSGRPSPLLPQRGGRMMDDQGNRVAVRQAPHGNSSDPATIDPHDSVRTIVNPDDVLPRLRAEHGQKALGQYQAAVDGLVASGMGRSDAHDTVRRRNPELWMAAKGGPRAMSAEDAHASVVGTRPDKLQDGERPSTGRGPY